MIKSFRELPFLSSNFKFVFYPSIYSFVSSLYDHFEWNGIHEGKFSPLISFFIHYCEDHFHIHITAFFFFFYLIYKYIYLIRLVPLHRIAKIMKDLDSLESYLRGDFANDAQMPGMQISAAVSSAACPAGKVIKVVPGDSSELERTVCSK